MKKIIITVLALSVLTPMSQANANCQAGYGNAVEVNATTKVVTYSCVKLPEPQPEPIRIQPIAPTHTVVVKTPNQSVGISGSLEAVTEQLAKITQTPQAPLADPCVLGACTKVDVNATTGITTVSPLSMSDLAQRYKDAQFQYQRNLELMQAAKQATIVPIEIEIITPEETLITPTAVNTKPAKAKKTKVKTNKKAVAK
jgi:hypothetical protein